MNEYAKKSTLINTDYEVTNQLYDSILNIYDIDKNYILAYIINNKSIKSKILKKWRNMFSF